MNLATRSGGETQDLDYKHDFKRKSLVTFRFWYRFDCVNVGLCKLLCTREGILINNVALWLERLTDVDWSENPIYSLLNPGCAVTQRIHTLLSPQDVPRAIKLLNVTADICNLDNSAFDPSEHDTHRALSLLGEMLEALVTMFSMSCLDVYE